MKYSERKKGSDKEKEEKYRDIGHKRDMGEIKKEAVIKKKTEKK